MRDDWNIAEEGSGASVEPCRLRLICPKGLLSSSAWDIMGLLKAGCCWAGGRPGAGGGGCGAEQGRRPRLGCDDGDWLQPSGAPSTKPAREVLLAVLPLLLPMLSPRVRMEMPLKLLALVTGGLRLRMEPSESVLLQGRGSRDLISLSVLLWRLPEARPSPSRLPLLSVRYPFWPDSRANIRSLTR